jgi:hypothetical protein
MAQTGYTPISIYYSTTAAATPTAGNLVAGELAINTADGKLFYKDSAGVVQVIGTKGGVGSSTTTQVLYNSSGLVVGSANMTFNGTSLTLVNGASIQGLTVGLGGGNLAGNVAVGQSALAGANSGSSYNTAVGYNALFANTTGSNNVGCGNSTLLANTSGSSNVALGGGALQVNTTASNNTAVGYQSLYANTTGSGNIALGQTAGYGITTGAGNISIGGGTMYAATTGNYNIAIGAQSGAGLTSGNQNAFVGGFCGQFTTTAGNNAALGYQALYTNTTGGNTVAIGGGALFYNTTAGNNVAVGFQTLFKNTTGTGTALGTFALYSNTTGASNVALGGYDGNLPALYSNTTGGYNTAVGIGALAANTTASLNVAIGYQSLYANTTGQVNTAIGTQAGGAITTGTYNIMIGYQTGNAGTNNLTTGNRNYFFGDFILSGASTSNDQLIIGYNATGKGSSTGFITAGATAGGIYNGANSTLWSITSDARLKKNIVDNTQGLAKILPIQVRNFEYRLPEEITDVDANQAIKKTGVQLGAIAQELQSVLPECVKQESTGIYTVDADPLIWYLVNAVKELKAEIDQLKGK